MTYYGGRHHYRQSRHNYPQSSYSKEYDGPHDDRTPQLGVVRRRNGSDDSIEGAYGDYPLGGYGYEYGYGHPHPRLSRVASVRDSVRRSHSMGDRDPYYSDLDYSRSRRSRRSRHNDDRRHLHRHPARSPSISHSSPPRRRKSLSDQALGVLGLDTAASSASKHRDRSRGRSRRHRSDSYSPSPTRSRNRRHGDKGDQRIAQAVKAALTAGAVEAFRSRKEPGDWTGAKGKRVLTAAITAGGADGLVDRDAKKHAKRHVVESTLAGLAMNHLMNGSSSRSRSKHRGRSKGRGSGLGDLAASGALAAAGKEAYSRFRSKSRHRGRSVSQDSYEDQPQRSKKRSKSVSDYINRGLDDMGALGALGTLEITDEEKTNAPAKPY
ncbi:hypothetical protein EYZ11_005339 [Aspergillus tanneri]|uniref:Uncharacterized protein n=1 Tax=Aspergillus tanneri TaxID=1220188 RepID=A0A4S3JIS3_9EURO|nr:hypothetical protein EYZ11_005339 [Aspergillus tanneri]